MKIGTIDIYCESKAEFDFYAGQPECIETRVHSFMVVLVDVTPEHLVELQKEFEEKSGKTSVN